MFLYIDPGTGSMLFAALIGLLSTLVFLLQKLFLRIRFLATGGRINGSSSKNKIPYVIFGEDGRYWNIFHSVCDEIESRKIECVYYTMDKEDPIFKAGYKHIHPSYIGEGNRAFAKLNMLNANLCITTTPDLDVLQWKRSKNVDRYIHIFHGVGDGGGYKMFGIDFFDSVLTASEFQKENIRRLEELRKLPPKELPVTGSAYLDELKKRAESYNTNKQSDEITVLLAPSWGKSAILSRFGDEILCALVNTGYHIIVRPHPQSRKVEKNILEPLMSKYPSNNQLEWDESNDNFSALSRADVMISDFSGVVFEYTLIFDGLVITADTNYDITPYDAAWFQEEVPWRYKILDQIGIPLRKEDFPNMKNLIADLIKNDRFREGRKKLGEQVWENRGNAAVSIVDYIEAQMKDLTT